MRWWFSLVVLFLLSTFATAQSIITYSKHGALQPLGRGNVVSQTITGISLSSSSFTGGAADGTTVGAITVSLSPASPAFSGTLSLTGTQQGSGNDKDSFRVSGSNLLTNTAGGATDQPGQYAINIVASGSYTNSGFSSAKTIQATGTGGVGWQLTFSDEFQCPNNMLNCSSIVSASAFTWANSFCTGLSSPSAKGCGTLTVVSLPSGISSAACTGSNFGACDISVAGATNGGTAGNTAVNGTFLVVGVPNSTTINLYMPYSGIASSMGGTINVGSGPWVVALDTSCTTGPCTGLPLIGSNDNTGEGEGWDPHACAVSAAGTFAGNITTSGTRYLNASGTTTANYIPPSPMQVAGNTYSATMCHIQTWNGSSGFSQVQEVYIDFDAEIPIGSPHTGIWALAASNVWNNGPELDQPECFGTTSCNWNSFGASSGNGSAALTSQDYSAAFHEFGVDYTNGGTNTGFLDGVSNHTWGNWPSGTAWYPILDATKDSGGSTPTDNSALSAHFVRVYAHVGSGACYSSIPTAASGTVPHVGAC